MGRYFIRRLLTALPVLIGASFLIFAVVFALPGDPIAALAGDRRTDPTIINMIREQFHLNDPLIVQYWYYIKGAVQGDFGTTWAGVEVSDLLVAKFQVTINLAITALAIEAVVGLLLGIWAALRRGKASDKGVLALTLLLISVPTLVLGFVLQLVLGVHLRIFPVSGVTDGWSGYWLPGIVLAGTSIAYLTRLTRTSLIETMRADFVRTAAAKGMSRRRVVGRHALRNALIPVVTFTGADLGNLMGGAIITERVFNLPGVGRQLTDSISQQEGPVVVGIVTTLIFVYIMVNLMVDLFYAVLDPRIRYE